MSNLKPPKNYREVTPRCCVTCVHYKAQQEEQGHGIPMVWNECERDIYGETGASSEEDYHRICDYYKAK